MRRVELLAELQATRSRSQEGSVAVLQQGAQAKASVVSAKRSLFPLAVVRVQACELLEASPYLVVKIGNSSRVEAWGRRAQGENHFAEACTAA